MEERTRGQAERGIFIHKPQLDHCGPLMRNSRSAAINDLAMSTDRVSGPGSEDFTAHLQAALHTTVLPDFDLLIAYSADHTYSPKETELPGPHTSRSA